MTESSKTAAAGPAPPPAGRALRGGVGPGAASGPAGSAPLRPPALRIPALSGQRCPSPAGLWSGGSAGGRRRRGRSGGPACRPRLCPHTAGRGAGAAQRRRGPSGSGAGSAADPSFIHKEISEPPGPAPLPALRARGGGSGGGAAGAAGTPPPSPALRRGRGGSGERQRGRRGWVPARCARRGTGSATAALGGLSPPSFTEATVPGTAFGCKRSCTRSQRC